MIKRKYHDLEFNEKRESILYARITKKNWDYVQKKAITAGVTLSLFMDTLISKWRESDS